LWNTFAVRYTSAPKETVDVVSWEIVERVPIGAAAPKVVVPCGPEAFGRK
jgi:hypothetical protein